MWRGIRCITDYKKSDTQCPEDPALPDTLNAFFARFEASNTTTPSRLTPSPDDPPVITITTAEGRRTLQGVNPRKASGPDGIPGRILKDCADQLSEVLADIFNTSLSQARVPSCLKTSTIIPVPKTTAVSSLNDYRPVALTPVTMKCFERLVMKHLKQTIDVEKEDPHQYAYRRNRSTADAIAAVTHQALSHLENRDSYVRLLFLDFSSAFNTIIPQKLVSKLAGLGTSSSLCNWVLDFLTCRPQRVRVNKSISATITLNTGSPPRLCAQPTAVHTDDIGLQSSLQK